MNLDEKLGSIVLCGDHNWRSGPFWPKVQAFLFGRRVRFTHLEMHCTIAWWRKEPYLIRVREARP
jgi:hypothetical protein